jgi:hypothetical protein
MPLVVFLFTSGVLAAAETKIEQYSDREYEYTFQYPAGWPIHSLPEGATNKEIRVSLEGPHGSSFTVIVDKADKKIDREEFQRNPNRKQLVEKMITDTIQQIYESVSKNIKATDMQIGERRDLSTDSAIKFYISTRHKIAGDRSVIVAGIHVVPFSKDYVINFLMTAFLENTPKTEMDALLFVFNSFHMTGEERASASRPPATATPPEAAEGQRQP